MSYDEAQAKMNYDILKESKMIVDSENDRLRTQLAAVTKERDICKQNFVNLMREEIDGVAEVVQTNKKLGSERDTLRAEVERLKADLRRYDGPCEKALDQAKGGG